MCREVRYSSLEFQSVSKVEFANVRPPITSKQYPLVSAIRNAIEQKANAEHFVWTIAVVPAYAWFRSTSRMFVYKMRGSFCP